VHGKDKAHELNLVETNEVEGMNAKVEKENSRNEHMKDTYRKQQMKDSTPGKTKVYKDQCTAFISNINLKASRNPLFFFPILAQTLEFLILMVQLLFFDK
jgi:hypothetical protein